MKNKLLTIISAGVFSLTLTFSHAQIITTIAGNTIVGYSGDGSLATSAEFNLPRAVAIDGSGNIFVSDYYNHIVRKINAAGIITTFAGNTTAGYAGDGGLATSAKLKYPYGVAVDAMGNVYIADKNNSVIRKVNTSGIISTFAGNGSTAYSGDGGPATSASLYYPAGVAFDTSGNLYIADCYNHVIRKVNTSGIISTVAGNQSLGVGYSGDGGVATSAQLNFPWGITIDHEGNLYIADEHNNVIRKVNTSGIITTFAGNSVAGYSGDGGLATSAELNIPNGVTIDAEGNIYISDISNNVIRKVNTSGIITTYAGNTAAGFSGDGGLATSAELNNPTAVALDASENLYIVDGENNVVRKVTAATGINQLASGGEQINLYPNPNTGVFRLTEDNGLLKLTGEISIYNLVGEKIYSRVDQQMNNGVTINLSQQPNGVYFIQLTTVDGIITKKIIVNK